MLLLLPLTLRCERKAIFRGTLLDGLRPPLRVSGATRSCPLHDEDKNIGLSERKSAV